MASRLGFEGLQLGDLGGAGKQFPMTNEWIAHDYVEEAEKHNILLHSLHLYSLVRDGTMLYAPNTAQGEQAQLSIDKGIDACRYMNIPSLMLSAFFATEIKTDEGFDHYTEHMKLAVDKAQAANITIVFESILHVSKIIEMLQTVGDGMGYCYDTGNPVRWNSGNPQDEIRQLIPWIDHVHVKDIPASRVGYCLLDTGIGEFRETIGFMKSLGYAGWYFSENYYVKEPLGTGGDFVGLARRDIETMDTVIGRGV
jgi:sugar phosphate isomerase/epimerase